MTEPFVDGVVFFGKYFHLTLVGRNLLPDGHVQTFLLTRKVKGGGSATYNSEAQFWA